MKVILNFLLLLAPATAAAYVLTTPEALLEQLYAGSPVQPVEWTPDEATRARLQAALGYPLPKAAYTFWEASSSDLVTLFDDQKGQHEPIDFAVQLTPAGEVRHVEILVYREAYGDGVKGPAFRQQFVGMGPAAPMRVGKEIRIVSGSTVSTRSITLGVRRAQVLVTEWLAGR